MAEYQDHISIAGDFPDEYAESQYTKKLRGAVAKVKANASQIIESLIVTSLCQYREVVNVINV